MVDDAHKRTKYHETLTAPSLSFPTLNYTHAHSPMYITFMQISQMIAGVVITVCGFIYSRDPECAVVPKVCPSLPSSCPHILLLPPPNQTEPKQTTHHHPFTPLVITFSHINEPIPSTQQVLYVQGVIYGSYLYLFLEFLVKRFFAAPSKKGGKGAAAASAGAAGGGKAAPAAANGNGHASLKKSQ